MGSQLPGGSSVTPRINSVKAYEMSSQKASEKRGIKQPSRNGTNISDNSELFGNLDQKSSRNDTNSSRVTSTMSMTSGGGKKKKKKTKGAGVGRKTLKFNFTTTSKASAQNAF